MNEKEAKKTLKAMKENIDKKYLKSRNSVAIETVLNLIQTQQAEIEQLKQAGNGMDLLLKQTIEELEKKDKIIDEMAEDIDSYQIECNRYFKDKEEVKQYFERKVENER